MVRTLEAKGHEIMVANDGDEAIDIATTEEPELIILGRDGRAPDVTTTELPADGGELDTGPDGDAFVLPDAGLRSCRPGRPTIQTADLVYPARVPVAGLQERYELPASTWAVSACYR